MRCTQVASETLMLMLATALLAVAQYAPPQPEALDLLRNVGLTYRVMLINPFPKIPSVSLHRPAPPNWICPD